MIYSPNTTLPPMLTSTHQVPKLRISRVTYRNKFPPWLVHLSPIFCDRNLNFAHWSLVLFITQVGIETQTSHWSLAPFITCASYACHGGCQSCSQDGDSAQVGRGRSQDSVHPPRPPLTTLLYPVQRWSFARSYHSSGTLQPIGSTPGILLPCT